MKKKTYSFLAIVMMLAPAIAHADGQGAGLGRGAFFFLIDQSPVQVDIGLLQPGKDRTVEWFKIRTLERDHNQAFMSLNQEVLKSGKKTPIWDRGKDERLKWMERRNEIAEEFIQEVVKLLTPEQLGRLKQIYWQYMSASALLDQELVEALQISAEQQSRIKEQSNEFFHQRLDLFAKSEKRDDVFRKTFDSLKEEHEKTVLNLLTESQRADFQRLKGAPYDFTTIPPF